MSIGVELSEPYLILIVIFSIFILLIQIRMKKLEEYIATTRQWIDMEH